MRQGAAFAALSVVHSGRSFRQRPCSQKWCFFQFHQLILD
ncbi:hypothetical protein CGRA01v4_06263 [Colletotrichum graminicola]|nr:hypothetical protein CGRA01v4_06263 [Colletotrichum graminicola]